MAIATFAAGCFWGVEELFRQQRGVLKTRVGYTGGQLARPTYRDVCSGQTGHAEAVEITFDPQQISYETLLKLFWENHDPTNLDRQGPDIGSQYRSVIFVHDKEQEAMAQKMKDSLDLNKVFAKPILTEILPAPLFNEAEEYHQQYLTKKSKL